MQTNNELFHYGVLGMRWGSHKKRAISTSTNKPHRQKTMNEMTNAELQAHNTRKQLEATYMSYHPKKVSRGKQFTSAVVNKVIIPVAVEAGKNYTKKLLADMQNGKAPKASK